MKYNWLLLTAGFGSSDMESAALRVKKQGEDLGIFEAVVAVTNVDLAVSCPQMYSKYSDYLNSSHKGFGYFSWKIELVHRALAGAFGEFDGVVWVDAGCEINNTLISKWRLRKWLRKTKKKGTFLFSLDTPERDFTKKLAFSEFPDLSVEDSSPQIQATWFILSGDLGRRITSRWLEVSLKGIEFLDLTSSPGGEREGFVEHRFDQSLLSLTAKSQGVRTVRYVPKSARTGALSALRGEIHPIWTTRNRSGDSVLD